MHLENRMITCITLTFVGIRILIFIMGPNPPQAVDVLQCSGLSRVMINKNFTKYCLRVTFLNREFCYWRHHNRQQIGNASVFGVSRQSFERIPEDLPDQESIFRHYVWAKPLHNRACSSSLS